MDDDKLINTFEHLLLSDMPEGTTITEVRHIVRNATTQWLNDYNIETIDVFSCKEILENLKNLPPTQYFGVELIRQEFFIVLEKYLLDLGEVKVH